MELDITILAEKIEKLKAGYQSGQISDILIAELKAGQREMSGRAFDDNKDVEGNSFGGYVGKKRKLSDRALFLGATLTENKKEKKRIDKFADVELTSYQRKRAVKGLQFDHKDLQFDVALRRNIEIEIQPEKEDSHSAVLRFSNEDKAKIARGQEQQITNLRNGRKGTTKGSDAIKIFAFSEDEKKIILEETAELLKQLIS